MNVRTVAIVGLGILVLLLGAITLPTPAHDWFLNDSIGPVPADIAVISVIILITPVTILSIIVSKFNVDFADEQA